jgi:hypothetical protein
MLRWRYGVKFEGNEISQINQYFRISANKKAIIEEGLGAGVNLGEGIWSRIEGRGGRENLKPFWTGYFSSETKRIKCVP